ncbi:MAG: ATP-binding protein [Bradymonadia bacterium]
MSKHRTGKSSRLGRLLAWRYLVALSLIFCLSCCGLFYLLQHLNHASSDGLVINLAGQQRMLNQRVALQTTRLQSAESDEERALVKTSLAQDIARMRAAHKALKYNESDAMAALLIKQSQTSHTPHQLEVDLHAYTATAERALAGEPIDLGALLSQSAALQQQLHSAVASRERAAKDKITYLTQVEWLLWGLTCLVLLVELWLIFLPSLRSVESTLATEEAMRKEAELAHQIQERFITTMSHEIRTPLNAIIGCAQLIQEHALPHTVTEHMHDLDGAAQHLLSLVDNILDAHKLSAGLLDLSLNPTPLAELTHEVLAICRPLATHAGLELCVESDLPGSHVVDVDAHRVRQILLNLIGNAIKFTPSGSITLGIQREAEGVSFSVSDTGPGIPEAQQHKLFERFQQLSTHIHGTGLGLSISRELATLMQGRLELTGSSAKGSTFTLWLPLTPVPAQSKLSAEPTPLEALLDGAPLEILVAEDNAINQRIIQRALEGIGCRVTVKADGQRALDAARENRFDLIVVDNQMPILNGEQTIRALRELQNQPTDPEVPIIVLTADATATTKNRTLAAGATAFMTKPVSIATLRAQVRALCVAEAA